METVRQSITAKLCSSFAFFSFFEGTVNLSVSASLIAPGLVVPGTFSVTNTEFYFEVDEDDPLYKKLDQQVSFLLSLTRTVLSRVRGRPCSSPPTPPFDLGTVKETKLAIMFSFFNEKRLRVYE
jgi:hypothetical protein